MATIKDRLALLAEFENLPASALVDEYTAAAYRGCSVAKLQRERWAGIGPKYIKDGASVTYRKRDLLAYLDACVISPSDRAA